MKKNLKISLFLFTTTILTITFANFYIFFKTINYDSDKKSDFLSESLKKTVEIKIVQEDGIESFGTGSILNNKILTNKHLFMNSENKKNYKEIFYRFSNVEEYEKTNIFKESQNKDLVLLNIKKDNFGFILNKNFQLGDEIHIIGNPHNLGLTISKGIISGINKLEDYNYLQTFVKSDITINPGNSGGPVINASGELVGIMTFRLNKAENVYGISFFISAIEIEKFLKENI